MKKIYLIAVLLIASLYASSQIHFIGSTAGLAVEPGLYFVNFSDRDDMFYAMDSGEVVCLNLDLTEFKRINVFKVMFGDEAWQARIFNISDKLFNNDEKMEILFTYSDNNGKCETYVVNEDGEILLHVTNRMPFVSLSLSGKPYNNSSDYLINTSQGYFLQLINPQNFSIDLYRLAGSLPEKINDFTINAKRMDTYINPSNSELTIKIPNDIILSKKNTLVIQNINGETIKSGIITTYNQKMDYSKLKKGIYIISLLDGNVKMLSTKIVVQ